MYLYKGCVINLNATLLMSGEGFSSDSRRITETKDFGNFLQV